jgi:putative flippase GtrA
VVNTSANRRWTFEIRGPRHAARHQLQGLGVFAATWAMTAGALLALGALWPGSPTPVQTLVVGAATVVATVLKFVLMRSWMFAPGPAGSPRANAVGIEQASV